MACEIGDGTEFVEAAAAQFVQQHYLNVVYEEFYEPAAASSADEAPTTLHSRYAAMPKSLDAELLHKSGILRHPKNVLVAPKTDGVRCWMLIVDLNLNDSERGAHADFVGMLVDRAGHVWVMPGLIVASGNLQCNADGSARLSMLLFDGELLVEEGVHATTGAPVATVRYIVYDLVALNFGARLFIGMSYEARLAQCSALVDGLLVWSGARIDVKHTWITLYDYAMRRVELNTHDAACDGVVFVSSRLAPPFVHSATEQLHYWYKLKPVNTIDLWVVWSDGADAEDAQVVQFLAEDERARPVTSRGRHKAVQTRANPLRGLGWCSPQFALLNALSVYSGHVRDNMLRWLRAHVLGAQDARVAKDLALPAGSRAVVVEFKVLAVVADPALIGLSIAASACAIPDECTVLDVEAIKVRPNKTAANATGVIESTLREFAAPTVSMDKIRALVQQRERAVSHTPL